MAEKLVYASTDTTIHVKTGEQNSDFGDFEIVEGHNLAAGETYPLSKLASYQQKAFEAGEVPSVQVVSESEAKKLADADAKVQELLAKANGVQSVQTSVVLGDDGSFSDHLVSDVERVANHAAQAKADDADSDEKVTVVGAESDDSPANAGETTHEDSGDSVQGSGGAEAADSKKSKSK